MNIVILTRSLNYGGAERQLVTLARGLHEQGHRVVFSMFYPGGPLQKDLEAAGVPVHSLNKGGRWDLFCFLWRLVRFIGRERPDILHGYLCIPNILAILLSPLVPRMRVVLGVGAAFVDLTRYDWLARLTYRLECFLARFADLVIVNSEAGLKYAAQNGFPEEKMIVIHNGIDTERFHPDREAGRLLRAEWGVKRGKKLIGLVGRLDPMKDHPIFLKAAALLLQSHNDLRFVCVGSGPEDYKKQLIDQSRELGLAGRIIWAGAQSDMPAVYNALDIKVLSSYGEGFPNVVGEAMACDVPCIVTNVGDAAIIVSDIGEVIPPKSPEALKSAIEKVLMKIAEQRYTQELNRQPIVNRFSVAELISKTEEAFRRLADDRSTA